jgi:hypothetical protein
LTLWQDILQKNENDHKKIYFQSWLDYQRRHNRQDNFIMYLNKHFGGWYKDFIKIRHPVAHFSHLYAEIKSIILYEDRKMQYLTMDIDGKKIELMTYCNDIQKEIYNLTSFIADKQYWDNQYDYESGT